MAAAKIDFRLLRHLIEFAPSFTFFIAGIKSEARRRMMTITAKSSMRVKPRGAGGEMESRSF